MRPAHVLLVCVVALLGIGVVMVHSAGMRIDDASMGEPLAVFKSRPMMFAGLSLGAFLLASMLNVRWLFNRRTAMNPAVLGLVLAIVLTALAMVPGIGREVNGAWRWIKIGPIQFQPSELVKHVSVLAIAWYIARRAGVMHRFGAGLLPALLMVMVACGVVVKEDLGTAVLVGLVAMCVLVAAGARLWQMALIMPFAVGAAAALVVTSPYRLKRITSFLDPWADPAGTGFHAIQSLLAFAGGGITGRGLGNGIQKFGYVPEDTTDFIFTVIAEELGVAGCGVVVTVFLVILWAGVRVVRESSDPFGRALALGVTLTVVIQATINIAVVTVVVPTKGIALPLVSNGGTGWIMTAFALGLVAALDHANALEKADLLSASGVDAAQEVAEVDEEEGEDEGEDEGEQEQVDAFEYEQVDEQAWEVDETDESIEKATA